VVIDAHTHLYAPEVSAAPQAWANANREFIWLQAVAPANRASIQGWASVDQLLRDMDEAGIDRVVLLGWYWEHQATADMQNGWFTNWIRAHPDRLSAFAAVTPSLNGNWLDSTRQALDNGFCGIGELLPQAQGFSFKEDSFAALMALAREYQLPTNLHVSDPVAAARSAALIPTPLEELVQMVSDFPENLFILAHWGGGLPFHELNRGMGARFRNVFYDTAASALLYDASVFRRVCDLVGAGRILFGTDYPLLTHPRTATKPGFTLDLQDARLSGLTEAELHRILGENTRRLLRLK